AFVAAGAVLGNRLLQIAAAMAVAAADACVPSQQRKARFTRMVELLRYPVGGRVAVGAVVFLTSLVHVIGHIAAGTFVRSSLVAVRGMAGGAGELTMLVGQWKSGLVVIELSLPPAFGLVAGSTVGAERPAVDVILAVTIDTTAGSFPVGRARLVAG